MAISDELSDVHRIDGKQKEHFKMYSIHIDAFILAFWSRKEDNTKFVTLDNSKIFQRTKTVHIKATALSSFVVSR